MPAATLPAFVLCLANSENKLCEVGRVYSTLEPVGKYGSETFWGKTLQLFKEEFKEAAIEDYLNQVDPPDDSFDGIEVTELESVFHQRATVKRKRKKKKKKVAATKTIHQPTYSIPLYVKVIYQIDELVKYNDIFIGGLVVGRTYRTSDFLEKWERIFKTQRDKLEQSTKKQWSSSEKALLPKSDVPIYLKLIQQSEKIVGLLGELKIGKTYRTDMDRQQFWKEAWETCPECFEGSTKLQWNLTRDHSVPKKAVPAPIPKIEDSEVDYCVELYNEIQRHGTTRLSYNMFKEHFEKYAKAKKVKD